MEKDTQSNIDKYLLPEVRCGFYIPTPMKQAWAADLKVLAVVDDICKRHNISYFADWGTLLGTVRHAGFIPWDDDLDICMKREDYIRFCEVAKTELPEDFCMHRFDTQDDFWLFLARVVSKDRICFEPDHLRKYNGFPYMASVDIFVLDYMYEDEKKEQARREKLLYLLAIAEEIIGGKRKASDSAIKQNLDEAEKKLGVKIPRSGDDRLQCIAIYKTVEEVFASVPESERGNLTQMMPWGLKGKGFVIPPNYYGRAIRLPFENTTMPVPYAFDAMLRRRYGNYLQPVKNAGGHDYPFFEGQKRALQEVLDFEIPEYKFERDSLSSNLDARDYTKKNSAKSVIREAVGEMMSLKNDLPSVQQIAVDIGNYIEEIWGSHSVISLIEKLCENLYFAYEKNESADEIIDEFVAAFSESFLDKKEVLFLYDSKEHLERFIPYIEQEKGLGNEVIVEQLLLYKKDYDGKVLIEDGSEKEAEDIPAAGFKGMLELRRPDKIYIQNPYDDTDACHSIEPYFYARNIRNFTDELVFVAPFSYPDFGSEMERDYYNLKYFLCTPGVTYADVVYAGSEKLKSTYIKKLTEFAGEDTKEVWEKRITAEHKEEKIAEGKDRKKLLYVISVGSILEKPAEKLQKIQKAFDTIDERKDFLDYNFYIYPSGEKMPNAIISVFEKYKSHKVCDGVISIPEMQKLVDECDAYYGDGSPFVPLFMEAKKPIMIAE